MDTIGSRIKAARLRLQPKITLAKIGDHFDVSPQAAHHWENDVDDPGTARVLELARFLKVPILWLLDGGDSPPPPPDQAETSFEALSSVQRELIAKLIKSLG